MTEKASRFGARSELAGEETAVLLAPGAAAAATPRSAAATTARFA